MFELKTKFNDLSQNKELLNISLFSIATCISLLGTSAYNFAISLYVLKITESGLSFASTLVLGVLSIIIVTPFTGVLADKLNKKRISITIGILNSFLLIFLYLLVNSSYNLTLLMIYISTFLLNFFNTIYSICIEAAKPNLVHDNKLISINSIDTIINSSSSILGPMIGGIMFAILDIKYFILINGASFIISALFEMFMDFELNYTEKGAKKEKLNFYSDVKEGVIYLKKQSNIYNIMIILATLNFFIGFSINVPMPYIINNVLQLSSNVFGIIQSTFSVGMILGAIMIKKIIKKYSKTQIIKSSNILLSSCMIGIGFSVVLFTKFYCETFLLIYFVVIMILAGLAISFIDIPIFYFIQQTIPDEFRGRVLSIGLSIAKIFLPIALIISGILINYIPSYLLSITGGALLCIFALLYIKNK